MKELLKGINTVKQNEKLSRYNNKIFVFRANEFHWTFLPLFCVKIMLLISLSFAHIFTWTCWQNTYLEHCLFLTILPIELIQAYPRQMRIIFALKFSYKFSHNQNYSRVSHARSWKLHVLNKRNRLTQNKSESPHVRHLSYKEKQMRIKINSNLSYLWASTRHLSISIRCKRCDSVSSSASTL